MTSVKCMMCETYQKQIIQMDKIIKLLSTRLNQTTHNIALVQNTDDVTEDKHTVLSKEEKEKQCHEELHQMKKKSNLLGADCQRQLNSVPSKGYVDKALMRRQTVGSDLPYEKTEQASVDIPIPETNKGYQMLEKMGWKLDEKLGAKGDHPEKVSEGSC